MKLSRYFFEKAPEIVAEELIGCTINRQTDNGIITGRIVETEAYGDQSDLASHARFGSSKRNQIMFGQPGILYVYHIYGIFYLTNIICQPQGIPGAVLIRSVEILKGKEQILNNISKSEFVKVNERLATGPGKLSKAYNIDKSLNGLDIIESEEIYLEKRIAEPNIVATTRIGIDYAKECKDLPWRFYEEGSKYISKS